ncbi:MAG: hypothetical protein ACSHX7_06720 [Luteolibacter sp.]
MKRTTTDLVESIQPTIQKVDRRQTQMRALRLALLALTAFVILLLAGFALDYLFAWRSPVMRWIFPVATLLGTLWFGGKALLSLTRREQPGKSARDIDTAYPALEERWSTVTNLAASKDSDVIKGSPELLAQVATEASDFNGKVTPSKVVSTKSLGKPILASLLAAAALIALCIGISQFTGKLSQRFFLPWNQVTLTEIQDTTPETPLTRGSNLNISASITGKIPGTATLIVSNGTNDKETTHSFDLKKSTDISFTIKKVTSAVTYRILSGDKTTPWRTVRVVTPPKIALTEFRLTPPAYTKQNPVEKDKLPFKIRSVEGTHLQLTFTSDQELKEAFLLHESSTKKLTRIPLEKIASLTYRYQAELTESFTFRPVIINQGGLENQLQPRCQITIFNDLPPSVKLLASSDDTVLDLEDTLQVEFEAKDDYGIEQAEIIVQTQEPGEEPKTTILPIDLKEDKGARKLRRTIDLPLEDLNLTENTEISYSVKVRDSRGLDEDAEQSDQLASKQSQDPSEQQQSSPASNEEKSNDPSVAENQDGKPTSPSDPSVAENERNKSNKQENPKTPSADPSEQNPSDPSVAQNQNSDPSQQNQDGKPTSPSDPSVAENQKSDPNKQDSSKTPSGNPREQSPSDPSAAKNQNSDPSQQSQDGEPSNPSEPSVAENENSEPKEGRSSPKETAENSQKKPQEGTSDTKSLSLQKPSEESQSEDNNAPENKLGKRSIDVESEVIGITSTSEKKVKVDKFTKFEDREEREKLTIPIENALSDFQAKIEASLKPVTSLVRTKEIQNISLSEKESQDTKTSTALIESAKKIAAELDKKTQKTPYAFAGRQLQDIALTSLQPAMENLEKATSEQLPLEALQLANSHLQTALNHLSILRKQYGTVKAEREKAEALREIKEMFVLYMEDMPLLLGGEKGSPYTRNFMEFTKEEAEAMQRMIDRKVLLNQKIAEILKDHPELQARLMSKKRDQAINIREALATQQNQQSDIDLAIKSIVQTDDNAAKSEAVFQFILGKQETITRQLALFIDRSTSWLPLESDRNDPRIKDYLTATHALSIHANKIIRLVEQRNLEQAQTALEEFLSGSQSINEKLGDVSIIEETEMAGISTYVANRLSELENIMLHQKQLSNDLADWSDGEYGLIFADHQRFLSNQTAELKTEIELNAASFLEEHEEIAKTHTKLQELISKEILKIQESTLDEMTETEFAATLPKLSRVHSGYTAAIALLDRLVYQIIDVIDAEADKNRQQANATPGDQADKKDPDGVTEEEALAKLMALVKMEQDYLKSFGIPCCRPANIEMLTDWEKKQEAKEGGKGKKKKPQDLDGKKQKEGQSAQAKAEAKARAEAKGKAKSEARKLAKQAQKAQQQANQAAKKASEVQQLTGQDELANLNELQGTSDWNTLPSDLRDELLQQRGQNPPKQYEDTIQDYFRSIAESPQE